MEETSTNPECESQQDLGLCKKNNKQHQKYSHEATFVHILHIPRQSGPLKLWTTSRTLNEFNDERQNTYPDYHIAAVTHTKNDFYKQI
jgi:hypothetical protein